MKEFPEDFKKMLYKLLGNEAEELLTALDGQPVVSIRLNRRKPGAYFPETTPVKWCASGFYLSSRPEFIFDPLLHTGAYYVQDASSMIYESLIERLVKEFERSHPGAKLRVLDLCAAPGGKTTAIINGLPDGCSIVANEFSRKRVEILKENLIKWGYPDVSVTNKDTSFYGSEGPQFDILAVDAPCSGEGMMRKDDFAREQWSPALIEQCCSLQKEILQNAVKALKPGGFLIYSTCTFNHKENEENAEFLNKDLGMENFDPGFPQDWRIPGGIGTDLKVFRFMPHKTKGEGLFLAVFRKPGEWTPTLSNPILSGRNDRSKDRKNHFKGKAKTASDVKTRKIGIPDITDILSVSNDPVSLPRIELTREQAIAYLRREAVVAPADAPKGPVIVTYKGLNLGPAKNIGIRLNNLYPKNWRILKSF